MKKLSLLLTGWLFVLSATAQLRLPAIIRDSMILQRDAKVNIWGWASANGKVTVSFRKKNYTTTTGSDGKWKLQLPATKAGGPYTIDIKAGNSITLKEILFGDVWFCSGQSNMVHQVNIHDITYANEIATANYPGIRQFLIPTLSNLQSPQDNLPTIYWRAAVGEDIRPFSAVAYFFAKRLYEQYNIPIGIINASVGGTPVEAWTSVEGLKDFSAIQHTIEQNKDTVFTNGIKTNIANAAKARIITDKGLTGDEKWFSEAYIPTGWRNINIPGYWEDQGLKDLNGIVWYRKEIDLATAVDGKKAKLFMGRIIDADEIYVNGKMIGTTGYQWPQRRYPVPDKLLKTGKNIIVIRVTNTNNKGGFIPGKPYYLVAGKDTIDLKGDWQYKVGEVFKPSPNNPAFNFTYQPAALYNSMVAPEINYTIKGFCWYQGEANTFKPAEYTPLLTTLINDWRTKWKQDSLPFLFVQLPGYMEYNYLPSESNWAMLREAQLKTLSVPKTAMVVALDLGEWNDIHPDNKKDVGERLALAAQKIAYKENIVYSGPVYHSATINGNKITINFDHIGGGLVTNDGEPPGEFSIAGADKKFAWANATIVNNTILVSSDEVANPMYVRYAWSDDPVNPNLYNKEGLPASPFRTDQ